MNNKSASASGLYGRRWRKLRERHLTSNPFCVMCKEDGVIRSATELDHKIKHGGDPELFFDENNLQGLCHTHHRGYKARQERSGVVGGCDAKGHPVEQRAHWMAGGGSDN